MVRLAIAGGNLRQSWLGARRMARSFNGNFWIYSGSVSGKRRREKFLKDELEGIYVA
jgi:hypothetical protein